MTLLNCGGYQFFETFSMRYRGDTTYRKEEGEGEDEAENEGVLRWCRFVNVEVMCRYSLGLKVV